LRDDRAVVAAGLAASLASLWCQQPGQAHEAQDPLATGVHAVLAPEPNGHLTVAFAGERALLNHPTDEDQQQVV